MSRTSNQKLKLIYLLKILNEKSDENNSLTVNEIILELNFYNIKAERKSIYDDIEVLRQYGIDIVTKKSKRTSYFVANRLFELAELKLLVDAVQCSKFVTHKKSHDLIKKIESLTSKQQAQSLHRQVHVVNRVKSINESIYYNVDSLHSAIALNKKVSFKYFDYNINKEKVFRKNGIEYIVSPCGLLLEHENYYLVAFTKKYSEFTHYRVDRMSGIKIIEEDIDLLPQEENFDIAKYSKKVFNMFGGAETIVTLQFDIKHVNAVIDRFGKDTIFNKIGDSHFQVKTMVEVSETFFAWLVQFGIKVKIISPQNVLEDYKKFLNNILKEYF